MSYDDGDEAWLDETVIVVMT